MHAGRRGREVGWVRGEGRAADGIEAKRVVVCFVIATAASTADSHPCSPSAPSRPSPPPPDRVLPIALNPTPSRTRANAERA